MIKFDELLVNFFETLKKGFLTWIAWMKKVEELKDLGCSVRGRFYDLAWSKPVLRAPESRNEVGPRNIRICVK